MLKQGLMALVATVASAGVANAQDWSGPYAGGSLGYATGDSSSKVSLGGAWASESQGLRDDVTRLYSANLEPDGATYGVYAGYSHQVGGAFVLGGEISYDVADISADRVLGQTPTTTFPTLTYAPSNSVDVQGILNARARFGYSFGSVLGYVSVGYATADVEVGAAVLSNGGYSKAGVKSDWVGGVSYGLGAEFALKGPWSIRGEYQRIDLEDITFQTAYRPGSTFTAPPYTETYKQDLDLDSFKVGVSYNF